MPNIFFPKGYFDEGNIVPGVCGDRRPSDEELSVEFDDVGCDNMDGEISLFHMEKPRKATSGVMRIKYALRLKEKKFWADKNESQE